MKPVLILHGGAGSTRPDPADSQLRSESLTHILSLIYPRLLRGSSALDAVTLGVELLENDPLFNAGLGSKIQSDGKIRMSASIMDGDRRRFAGCINVQRVKNPIILARKLLTEKDRVLEGKGAEMFARAANLSFASPYTKEQLKTFRAAIEGKTGTVGALALDSKRRLAAATSTGGRGFEYPGRVSDSATVAANFANSRCAVSATGVGEEIVEFAVAATVCSRVDSGEALAGASEKLLRAARAANALFGWIGLDRKGGFFAGTSTQHLTWAIANSRGIDIHS